jgi:hypothetical protein
VVRGRGVRRVDDGVEVVVGLDERDALRSVPPRLRAIVESNDPSPTAEQVRRRLFPSAYADEEADAEFRQMAEPELVQERLDALDTFLRTLDEGAARGRRWEVRLSGDEAAAWLAVINDARLVLAGTVGITDESDWEKGPDEQDPASVMLFYLGWLEEELVGALAPTLDDDA